MNWKEEFWERVQEVDPADIMSGTVKVVSDENINWLLEKLIEDIPSTIAVRTAWNHVLKMDAVELVNIKQQLRDKWLNNGN